MHFANPEALALLLLLPIALWWLLRPRRYGAFRFPNVRKAAKLPVGWAVWGPTLLALLRTTALALLVVALARPQTADGRVQVHSDGIAVQLVIDISQSMKIRDYEMGSQAISRLDAVKHAVRLFVAGGEHGLAGRPNDKIGIVTFGRDPDVACPLTLDHDAVLDALARIELGPPLGTNIGDGLAWALDRLRLDPTKQKVVILLSDGAHNVKDGLPPLEAARLAADLGIKVYTIGAVGNRFPAGGELLTLGDLMRQAGRRGLNRADSVDEPMMQEIAELTGGRYFRATDTNGLTSIYQEIDQLETTRLERTVQTSQREWFLLLVVPGVGLLVLEQLLAATRLMRVP